MAEAADFLAEEMAFAKLVSTEKGDALLIAGKVYEVTGPGGNCAELFSSAMRRVARGNGPEVRVVGAVVGNVIAASTLNS